MDSREQSRLDNSPSPNFDTPKIGNSKLILSSLGVFVVLLIIGFFVYKNFSKNPSPIENQPTTSVNTIQETPKVGYSLYRDTDTAVSFQYPQTLFLLDRDEEGSKMLPNIFFQNYQYPKQYSRNACPVDCINFSAFLRLGNGLPYYDIPLRVERDDPQFPIYGYPRHVYKDETDSKPFQINGLEAVRYYAAGFTDSYVNAYARDQATPVEYTVEDRVFIKDPNLSERIIYIVYQEKTNKLPSDAKLLSGATIKGLFNQEKYKQFQDVLASVRALPIDKNQLAVQSSKELGVSFQAPEYWGKLVESLGGAFGSEPQVETISLSFKGPLLSWDDPARIEFEADNSKTANYVYEGSPPLYQYSGQSLDNACQKNAYLDSSGSYDIKLSECNLRTLTNGVKLVIFKGNFAYKYEYSEGEIPSDKRQFIPFKGAILQTKSDKWPGMSIHFEGTNVNFADTEKLFDKIINSLSYSAVISLQNTNECIGKFITPISVDKFTLGNKVKISWRMPLGIDTYYSVSGIDLLSENQKLGGIIPWNWVKYNPITSADWDAKTVYNSVYIGPAVGVQGNPPVYELKPDQNVQLQPGKYKLRFSYSISDSHTDEELGNCSRKGSFESDYFEIVK